VIQGLQCGKIHNNTKSAAMICFLYVFYNLTSSYSMQMWICFAVPRFQIFSGQLILPTYIYPSIQGSSEVRSGSRGAIACPKPTKITYFFHHNFVQFGKKHSRYKDIRGRFRLTDKLSVLYKPRRAKKIRGYHIDAETSSVSSGFITRGYLQSNAQNRHPFCHLPQGSPTWCPRAVAARDEHVRKGCEFSSLVEHIGLSPWLFL